MAKKHVNRREQNTHGNRDNRANQLNPNNDGYWKARGHENKPSNRNKASSTRKK
jgi:hypothetical protein